MAASFNTIQHCVMYVNHFINVINCVGVLQGRKPHLLRAAIVFDTSGIVCGRVYVRFLQELRGEKCVNYSLVLQLC